MLQAVLFDLYGTLIDIGTDEGDDLAYAVLARFLSYLGMRTEGPALKAAYFQGVDAALRCSAEEHPEVDVTRIFGSIVSRLDHRGFEQSVVLHTTVLFRALTIKRFALFRGAREALLDVGRRYPCGCVTDAQWAYTEPEMAALGLDGLFSKVTMSSRLGFRKPDPRMFTTTLASLGANTAASVYVGDNPERDIAGARAAGMRCILFAPDGRQFEDWGPDAVFGDYRELPGIIERIGSDPPLRQT